MTSDEAYLRLLGHTTLADPAYRILEATDGNQALAMAQTEHPDLLVLDWMMPGLSGIAVAQTLRQDPATADIPIIMLTAKGQDIDVETNSPVALVDITGVPTIDTQTAQHLIETITAVRLLGAQVVLTGVRPALAQTLVHLGIDLSHIVTRSSLSAGLRVALDLLDLQVISKNGRQ